MPAPAPSSNPHHASPPDQQRPSQSKNFSLPSNLPSPDLRERDPRQPTQHRHNKTKSSSHIQHPRRESSIQANHVPLASSTPGSATQTQRPPLKSRAYSAPLVPKTKALPATPEHNGDEDDEDASSDVSSGDEIAHDPFFQRYNFSQDGEGDDQPREAEDGQTLHSPASNMRGRPDSTAEPAKGSPLSPRSPRSVRTTLLELENGI
jgi:hypothetical protein